VIFSDVHVTDLVLVALLKKDTHARQDLLPMC